MRDPNRGVRSAAMVALLAGVVALIVVLAAGGGISGHRVYVTVSNATDVVPGQYVKAAGVNVGQVDSLQAVDGGHHARVGLILENRVWPLPRGTRMTLKWGGTVSFVNRYIDLVRGTGGGDIAPRGVFPGSGFSTPVEFDGLLNTFQGHVRTDLGNFLSNAGVTFHTASPALRRALGVAPAALAQTSAALGDLDSNESALNTLVRAGAQVVDSVQRADPGLQPLVTGAASTFSALASRTRQLASTLAAAPATLAQTRSTLAAAEPTLNLAREVTTRVAPGVDQVRRIATPLDQLLVTLRNVGPDAISALASARAATPSLNPLLVKARQVIPQLGSISRQATTSLICVRPYTPDIIAFATDWGDFLSAVDGKDHYFRAQVQTLTPAPGNAQPYNSAQIKKLLPFISYVFPPPPGYAAGQPWFLPQCNAGPSTLDPNQDPENNPAPPQLPAANATPIDLSGSGR